MAKQSAIALKCPFCRRPLADQVTRLDCAHCGKRWEVEDGIPILTVDETLASGQAAYFDSAVDAEFEIERPRGLPRLHAWLLNEKFQRGVAGINPERANVLVVCGGSGMDAEFLVRRGARVITSDISRGAALRARERAQRHGLDYDAIVANVERLPFADRSVDIVYVHDGLHHIENPLAGLREMARVAGHAVCLTEPADALITAVAVKAGVALEREEAGNRVARMRLGDVRRVLESEGFRIVRAGRYAMFYRHKPGPIVRALSRPALLPLATCAFRLGNLALGSVGNKLAVVAVRQ